MTIHKSQGSQFDEVVVVLPGESTRLLTRELLLHRGDEGAEASPHRRQRGRGPGAVARSVQRASGLGVRLWGDKSTTV